MTPGWALGAKARSQLFSYVPHDGDPEPAYAVADAWEPPHPLALPEALCDRLVAAAAVVRPLSMGHGAYHLVDLAPADEADIVARFRAANTLWWRLDIDRWDVRVQHYGVGERFPAHQDLHAGAAGRKLAGTVQLSDPDAYEGGDLVMHFVQHRAPMPKTRGTLVAFPGWSVHEVTPITRGERWALIVNGFGPPLR